MDWKDNPHKPGTPEHLEWWKAWHFAHENPYTDRWDEAKAVADARLNKLKEELKPSEATVKADAIYDEVVEARKPYIAPLVPELPMGLKSLLASVLSGQPIVGQSYWFKCVDDQPDTLTLDKLEKLYNDMLSYGYMSANYVRQMGKFTDITDS